jgi:hypothetical protein
MHKNAPARNNNELGPGIVKYSPIHQDNLWGNKNTTTRIVVHRVLTRVKKSCWVLGTINLRTVYNEAVQSSLAVRCQIDRRIEDGVPGAPPWIFEFPLWALRVAKGFAGERNHTSHKRLCGWKESHVTQKVVRVKGITRHTKGCAGDPTGIYNHMY